MKEVGLLFSPAGEAGAFFFDDVRGGLGEELLVVQAGLDLTNPLSEVFKGGLEAPALVGEVEEAGEG